MLRTLLRGFFSLPSDLLTKAEWLCLSVKVSYGMVLFEGGELALPDRRAEPLGCRQTWSIQAQASHVMGEVVHVFPSIKSIPRSKLGGPPSLIPIERTRVATGSGMEAMTESRSWGIWMPANNYLFGAKKRIVLDLRKSDPEIAGPKLKLCL